ncbi:uncharacterized protein TNCV_2760091 [Trichonephila clavipes]|nr:uncharacterized protein TNCV_2760091 [Trichonephila clavipes]
MIQKELNIGSAAIYKIMHDELHMKKVVCCWIPHNLTEHQEEHVRISKETLKSINDGGHCIISKIVTEVQDWSKPSKWDRRQLRQIGIPLNVIQKFPKKLMLGD